VTIVVDSNVLVALVIPIDYSEQASDKMDGWLAADADLVSPALWSYEAVSAIRKFVASGKLTGEEAQDAMSDLMDLGIREVPATADLHHRALDWAERLKDFVAYDPAYLALAETLKVDFWSADSKLVRKVKALGIDWVHDISESTESLGA
jgi:predicted nucleic acid-binding protein